jgi:PAS domain S-box-containing protein
MAIGEKGNNILDKSAYSALHSLLNAAATSFGAEHACLIAQEAEAQGATGAVVLAASDQPEQPEGACYNPDERDATAEVVHNGQVMARLVLGKPQANASADDLALFASTAGFILGQSRVVAQAATVVEESRVLRELGLQLGQPTELEQMLNSTIRGIRRLLNADYSSIATLAADGTTRWVVMDGNVTDAYKHTTFPPGRGTTARIVDTRKPLILQGIGQSEDLPPEEYPVHVAEGGVSAMSVPLMRRGVAVGALIVGSRKPRDWTDSELQLASVLANSAAIAIEQVQTSGLERSQRAFLEKIVENYPGVLVVMAPPEFRIVRANSQLNQFLPEPYHSGEPVVGRKLQDLFTEWKERGDALVAMLSQVVETGEPISFEQYVSESPVRGTTYWNWTIAPIEDMAVSGQRMAMLIAHEITEVVLARQKERQLADAVRARAEELDAIITQMADGVIIFDAAGHVVRLNPASEDLLGQGIAVVENRGEHPGLYGLRTLSGEPCDPAQMPSALALKGEKVVGAQVMIRRLDGEEVIVSVSASPLTDDDGDITGAVAVMHDITEDKVAERLKDEFLSVVSHELRTPLSAIMGYSDLMLRGVQGALNERQARALNAVRANADRLLRLINDLLDVSRLESGVVMLNLRPTTLSEVVARTIAQTRILAVNAGIHIENRVPSDDLLSVMADETKLQQIIENLLTNAIKFTPTGGSVVITAHASSSAPDDPIETGDDGTVRIDTSGPPQSVVVTVRDTGTGLESDQLTRIWDKFYQVDASAKRRSGGAGLGLSIVRNLVELHGGHVLASSPGPNQGSSFSFTLPIATVQDKTASVKRRRAETSPDRKATPDAGTVLVAEDDDDQREIICDMLELEGYKVVVASDGNEALELAAAIKPSAIALDVILPRADGWEVLNRLRSDPATRDIPVLIISVVDQQEFGKKLGANEYLIKPLESVSLRAAVRRLIQGKSAGA